MSDDDPTMDPDAVAWRDLLTGVFLGVDGAGRKVWRRFCARCHKPIEATEPYKNRSDMVCSKECAIHSGHTISSTAFSPDRRLAD